MMTNITQKELLVITPTPKTQENWLGWLLRATEMNGYDRPTRILSYAGLSNQHFLKSDPPLNELSGVFGFGLYDYFSPTLSLKKFAYSSEIQISHIHCNLNKPKICIKCIEDNKFANRLWDLKYTIACTVHNTVLTTQCHACKNELIWNRRGLLKCGCGQKIQDNPLQVSAEIISIINLINWKVFDDQNAFDKVVTDGYPIKQLSELDVNDFLGIFHRILKRPKLHIKNSQYSNPMFKSLEACFHILSDWPNKFWDYLEFHAIEPEININFTTQFKTFYHTFCVSGQRAIPIQFLHDSLIAFGDQRWKKSTVAKKSSKRAGIKRTTFGVNTLAVHLGVGVPTILKYQERNLIDGKKITAGNINRYIFNQDDIPYIKNEGETLTQRKAAQYLHIPQRLLSLLVKNNVYKRKRLARGFTSFSKLDLDEFINHVIQGNTKLVSQFIGPEWIPLQTLISKKTISMEIISNLLKLSVDRKIEYLSANEIPLIRFDRKTLIQNFGFEWLSANEQSVSKNLELF